MIIKVAMQFPSVSDAVRYHLRHAHIMASSSSINANAAYSEEPMNGQGAQRLPDSTGTLRRSMRPSNQNETDSASDGSIDSKPCCCSPPILLPLPYGTFMLYWTKFIIIILTYSLVEIPFVIAFEISMNTDQVLPIIGFIIDILFLVDIVINFRVWSPFQLQSDFR